MRQPVGLYLADFAVPEPMVAGMVGLPCFDVGDLAPDLAPDPSLPALPDESDLLMPTEPDDGPIAAQPTLADDPIEPPPPDIDEAAILEALQAEHAAALLEARQRWVEQEGATLAAGLQAALDGLAARVADILAPLLEPFLVEAAQVQALAGLRAALGTLLDGELAVIAVSGPADLLAALRESWAGRDELVFTESDATDVTITAGDTRIRSQLADWARALQSTLGASA